MIAKDRQKVFQIQIKELMMGLTANERRGKVQLKLRKKDEKQQSVMLPFDWSPKTFDDAYTRTRNIYKFIVEGHNLKAAAELAQGKAPKRSGDWSDILKKFEDYKQNFGSAISKTTWKKDYKACDMAVKIMAAKNPPSDPTTLIEMCLKDWKSGSRTRQIRVRALNQFLTFAVEREGLADTWLPQGKLRDFIGKVKKGDEPKKIKGDPFDDDQQILDLLASLETDVTDDKVRDAAIKWFNAICMMSELGLRPIEVGEMQVKKDPKTKKYYWWCTHEKKAGNGVTEPRRVRPLPLIDRDGNIVNWNLLERFRSNLLPLPENIDGDSFRSYLIRRKGYVDLKEQMAKEGKNLVTYSFRHYYSLRSHIAGIDVGTVCKSMGHKMDAHIRAYPYAKDASADDAYENAINRMVKEAKGRLTA